MANGRYILSVDTKMGDTSGLKQLKTELMQLESLLSSNKQKGRLRRKIKKIYGKWI